MKQAHLLLFLFLTIGCIPVYSQIKKSDTANKYLSFQSGASINNYNSFGARVFFEFQKDLSNHWQYGISFEQNIHLYDAATDHSNTLSSNVSIFSYNHYYKIKIYKDRFFWTSGIGVGLMNVNWGNLHNKLGPAINASMTLNMRLNKKLYIETSPLIILLPTNRGYYSPVNADVYTQYYSGTFFPFGIKIKL